MPLSQATVASVFRPWDGLQILLEDTQGPVEIMTNMSPDAKARAAGEACLLKINEFNTEIFQNEKIYARIQRTVPADAVDRKLKKDVVEAFVKSFWMSAGKSLKATSCSVERTLPSESITIPRVRPEARRSIV